mmetsp:Transcript_5870/g.9492  ORF Transcript_5870/g.9492 Transcript_5870/m.9492 type:complete len:95 (+) Transcript_5870:830-1114(+)
MQDSLKTKRINLRLDWKINTNLKQSVKDSHLAPKDVGRFKDSVVRGREDQGGLIVEDGCVMAEEEASIINLYLNSQKKKKDDRKQGNLTDSSPN